MNGLADFLPILILLFVWLVPVLIALSHIRRRNINEAARALWVLIILIVPIVGPVVYLVLFRKGRGQE